MRTTIALIPVEFLRHASAEDRPGEVLVRLPNKDVAFVKGSDLVQDFDPTLLSRPDADA